MNKAKSKKKTAPIHRVLHALQALLLLYLFLLSINMMGEALKGMDPDDSFKTRLIKTVDNPFLGLFAGILLTSIIQSSSATTSITVTMVGSGFLSIRNAIPIVMGANIGTTITNTIVAIACVGRRDEFRRAFAGATLHDFFNIFLVVLLFPIEMSTRYLERSAKILASLVTRGDYALAAKPKGLAHFIFKPVSHWVHGIFVDRLGVPVFVAGWLQLALALLLLFTSLYFFSKIVRRLLQDKLENVFDTVLFKKSGVTFLLGAIITAVVQSSSITTSLIVPLAGAGIISLQQIFFFTMGANVGTTVTAILASLAVSEGALAARTIAIVHLLFNASGIIIFAPFRTVRQIPIAAARAFAETVVRKRRYAALFVFTLFILVPALCLLLYEWLGKGGGG